MSAARTARINHGHQKKLKISTEEVGNNDENITGGKQRPSPEPVFKNGCFISITFFGIASPCKKQDQQ